MNYKRVIYKDKKYLLIHEYTSGYCEIKKEGALVGNAELVRTSELLEATEVTKEKQTR